MDQLESTSAAVMEDQQQPAPILGDAVADQVAKELIERTPLVDVQDAPASSPPAASPNPPDLTPDGKLQMNKKGKVKRKKGRPRKPLQGASPEAAGQPIEEEGEEYDDAPDPTAEPSVPSPAAVVETPAPVPADPQQVMAALLTDPDKLSADELAEFTVTHLYIGMRALGGDEANFIKTDTFDERAYIQKTWRRVFQGKDCNINPLWLALGSTAGYIVLRLSMPKTRQNVATVVAAMRKSKPAVAPVPDPSQHEAA